MNKGNNKSKVFYCYSPTLKCELMKIGEEYIAKGVNQGSGRAYWLFLRTERLQKYLDERPKRENKINYNKKNPDLEELS